MTVVAEKRAPDPSEVTCSDAAEFDANGASDDEATKTERVHLDLGVLSKQQWPDCGRWRVESAVCMTIINIKKAASLGRVKHTEASPDEASAGEGMQEAAE
jgi:hypothetical protein